MNETFLNTVVEKIEQLDEAVNILTAKQSQLISQSENFEEDIKKVISLNNRLETVSKKIDYVQKFIPETEILSGKIDKAAEIFSNPPKFKFTHRHRFDASGWIIVILLMIISLLTALTLISHRRLDQYLESDTKYRQLKLMDNQQLNSILYTQDSLYLTDPGMRQKVLLLEKDLEQKTKLRLKAERMEAEANKLREEARKIKK